MTLPSHPYKTYHLCRTMQTAANCCEGLGIPPEKWTVTCAVCEVMHIPAEASCCTMIVTSLTE